MKTLRIYLILFSVLVCTPMASAAFETESLQECRLAFLLGMSGFMKESDGWENLPRDGKSQLYEKVARAYAVDLGATSDELADKRWKDRVLQSLSVCQNALATNQEETAIVTLIFTPKNVEKRNDLRLAYLSGAYACYGTPTGFRLIDKRQGSCIALLAHWMFQLKVESTMRTGIPGNITITVSEERKGDLAYFFVMMQEVREAILPQKTPN